VEKVGFEPGVKRGVMSGRSDDDEGVGGRGVALKMQDQKIQDQKMQDLKTLDQMSGRNAGPENARTPRNAKNFLS